MPEVRGDWDQDVTRHDQDDVELAYRLATGQYQNYQAIEWEFRAFGYPQSCNCRVGPGNFTPSPSQIRLLTPS